MFTKVLLTLAGTLAWGQATDYRCDEFLNLPGFLWEDAKTLALAPGSWTSSDWTKVGLGAAAVLGTALVLDRPLDDAAWRQPSPGRDRLARDVAGVGGTGGLVLLGAGYATFTLLDRPEPRSVVVDLGLATVLAQAAILPLKVAAGRARPGEGLGPDHFRPLTAQDAFPSGHTTQAFAMASVLSMRAPEPWVGWCAYGAAGLVGLARMDTRDHYASDVLAGALVGTAIGRAVVVMDRRVRSHASVQVTPVFSPGFRGLTLQSRF